ncbi:MAG: hypothetical protein AAFR71_02695 [Pseudomonadota bacterium]
MKKTLIAFATLGLVAACSTTGTESVATLTYPTKTYTGQWDGVAPTSLQFLSASQVRYCFRNECTTRPYSGSAASKVDFNWGRNKFTFTKVGSGYRGTFRGSDGSRSTVTVR